MVVCKRLHGSVQVVAVIRSYGWSVQAAMWWCASGYVVVCKRLCGGVVAHEILVSAPVPFGFRSYWDLVGVGHRGFWD